MIYVFKFKLCWKVEEEYIKNFFKVYKVNNVWKDVINLIKVIEFN